MTIVEFVEKVLKIKLKDYQKILLNEEYEKNKNNIDSIEDKFPYILGEKAEMYVEGKWIQGVIVYGYRYRDGIVTIKTDDGKRYWCGEARKELYRKI